MLALWAVMLLTKFFYQSFESSSCDLKTFVSTYSLLVTDVAEAVAPDFPGLGGGGGGALNDNC